MTLDPGLQNDACVYMKQYPGDTGPTGATSQRTPTGTWWLSPDIDLAAPNGTVDIAQPDDAMGNHNTVTCTFWVKQANCLPANNRVRVECWVGNPNLTMTPSSNTFQLANSSVVATNMTGASTDKVIQWQLNVSGNPNDPQSPGHKCLIARCYPNELFLAGAADGNNFHQIDDCHYAQRNICIVNCSSPCGIAVETTNPNLEEAEETTIFAIADLKPTQHVFATALQTVQQYDGFEAFSRELPPPFEMKFEDFPRAKIVDNTRKLTRMGRFGRYTRPNFAATFKMEPKQTTRFEFNTDLDSTPFGQAHIIHLMHMSRDQRVLGGLTIVAARGLKERYEKY